MTPRPDAVPETLGDLLPARVATMPDALAYATDDESLTYRQLAEEVEALATAMSAAGVSTGNRVGLCIPSGLDFVRAFLALQHLGASPCAFDPAAPPATLLRRLERLRPRVALVAGPSAEALAIETRAAGLECLDFDELELRARDAGSASAAPRHRADANAAAFLQPTSGTSGEPRLAIVLHRNALASLESARTMLGIVPEDVLVGWVPPWHDLGLMRFVLGPVFFGIPCHLVPPAIRTLPLWIQTIARVRGTVTGATDLAYRLAAKLVDPAGLDLSSLRLATNGGEPVRGTSVLDFEQRFGLPGVVRPGYGLAEATLGVTCLARGAPLRLDDHGNVSCGTAMAGVELRIDGPPGEAGEILVRSPAVFAGYFEAPQATAETLRNGWLHTGDIGKLDDEGHLYVLGRNRALLKRGGVPLAPRELEEAAERVPGVRAAAAVALPPDAGSATEHILLALERDPKASQTPPQIAAAAAAAVERAIGFGPDRVMVLATSSIPRTTNGKTRYTALVAEVTEGRLEASGSVLFGSQRAGS